MDESRRLAMRRAHARRVSHCTCGKNVAGNGGRTSHSAAHKRRGDGHYYMTYSEYERRVAAGEAGPSMASASNMPRL